jgi:tRNA(fMet)-specific endonuclease VapC
MTPTLLDTDTLTLFQKNHLRVAENAAFHIQFFGHLIFSELNYYEVTRGLKAAGASSQLARFEHFCLAHRILPFTHHAAVLAADLWADLKRRGQLIGEIDLLIAATALNEGLAVATHNVAHFSRIPGLTITDWTI